MALKINKNKLDEWLSVVGMSQAALAKEIGIDEGNFHKMLNGDIPTSKTAIEKILNRTLIPIGVILTNEPEGKA